MAKELFVKGNYIHAVQEGVTKTYSKGSHFSERTGNFVTRDPEYRPLEIIPANAGQWTDAEGGGGSVYTATLMRDFFLNNTQDFSSASGGSGASFVEEKTAIVGSVAADWEVRSLGLTYANKQVQVMIEKTGAAQANAGVKAAKGLQLMPFLVFKENGGDEREITADINGDIEIWCDNALVNFWLIGSK